MCFAGPVGTADDLIATRAVPCFANALVITADAGLAKRCRSAARGRDTLRAVMDLPLEAVVKIEYKKHTDSMRDNSSYRNANANFN